MLIIVGLIFTFPSVILAQFSTPTYDPNKQIDAETCKECLMGGLIPEWVTADPKNPTELYVGELVDLYLIKGKAGDGSIDCCQYNMRLKKDPSKTWNCVSPSNSAKERLRQK